MSQYIFNSTTTVVGHFNANWSQEEVKNEPMLFNCDCDNAYRLGGPITKQFLDSLPPHWANQKLIVDSRVHMLMPGWYPCIPGFHHDDVPRRKDAFGQPNYDDPAYHSRHLVGLVNAEICPTRFAVSSPNHKQTAFILPAEDRVVYRVWHDEVVNRLATGELYPVNVQSGQMVEFDWQSWHEGQKATANGWRWFIRASVNTDRVLRPTNEIRRQVQVYMEYPTQGW